MGLAVAHAVSRESTVLISDVSHERIKTAKTELDKAGSTVLRPSATSQILRLYAN